MTSLVSHYNSAQVGASTLSGVAGTTIAGLDACLVNGWGVQTATSLVVSGSTATLTLPATPAMLVDGLVEVGGATPSGLNGKKKVLTKVGNVLTFSATGITAGTATGTITAKVASLGWTKVYSGTNLAVYKSGSVEATGCYLRVDDTGAQVARVVGYETMSDVNTGTGAFPTAAQLSGGTYWAKSSTATSTARQWVLVGDERGFYFVVGSSNTADFTTNTNGSASYWFGDIVPLNSADNIYSCMLTGSETNTTPYSAFGQVSSDVGAAGVIQATAQAGVYLPRSYTGLGSSIGAMKVVDGYGGGTAISGALGPTFPNRANNGLLLSKISVSEPTTYRGQLPGVAFIAHSLATPIPWAHGDVIAGAGSFLGRNLKYLKTSAPPTTSFSSACFFDITGPWR